MLGSPHEVALEHQDPAMLITVTAHSKECRKEKQRPHQMRSLVAKSQFAMLLSRQMKFAELC